MPLRCIDSKTGQELYAFDLDNDHWHSLVLKNRAEHHFKASCCNRAVIPKTSHKGTRFFAHKRVGICSTGPETEAHLRLKQMAVVAARANGWNAATEVAGSTPTGERWIADVLAVKGRQRVAIEIQWSRQTNSETLSRQLRFEKSGIRGLWLMRHPGFPISRKLPAAQIVVDAKQAFWASLKTEAMGQQVPMEEFLNAAFSRHLRFGIPLEFSVKVLVRVASLECWRSACKARTHLVTSIGVKYGPYDTDFTVPDLTDHPDLFAVIREHFPDDPRLGEIKKRFSKTQGRSYLSNGCVQCGGLMGEHFNISARLDEMTFCEFETPMSVQWGRAIARAHDNVDGWGVYW